MDSKKFLKYLKSIDFPNKNYNAIKSYPDTKLINGIYINDFNKRYKKKFLYNHNEENISDNKIINNLFNNSLSFISKVQNNLYNYNINNYISGGAALKLYTLYNKKLIYNYDPNILTTKDIDIYLYLNEKKITNIIIINNLFKLLDSVIISLNNTDYSFLELYVLINFENTKEFNEIIKILMDNSFELYLYSVNKEENIYILKFIKVIDNEFCIRIKLKFRKIEKLLDEEIYSYIKLTNYFYKKINYKNFKYICKNLIVEFLVKNKNKSNIELMKNTLKYNNNLFYIYNEKTILYNLMHLFYKYKFDTNDNTIQLKKNSFKDIRDEKRLNLFFKIFCNTFYSNLNNIDIDNKLNELKNDSKSFKKNIENIKNFNMIDKIMK
jgi:hypothetical protein